MARRENGRRRVMILGAGGRDFHDFNVVFRNDESYHVVAFTAAQIPNISNRTYPPELSGRLYPDGIQIFKEAGWEDLLSKHSIDEVVFAYSDVSHAEVMEHASRAIAMGAGFRLLGAAETMLKASKPVISVCAVRTGCGKSPVTRHIAALLRESGLRVGVVRHPMPYGDLRDQIAQRFAEIADLSRYQCTIEEMEEYEPHIVSGDVVFAGVDYEEVLRLAEAEADVIVWDGGNNDLPFFEPDLEIVLADPHRPGHELSYFPGEANLLRADAVILSKCDTAASGAVQQVAANVRRVNPAATLIKSAMPVALEGEEGLRGKRVLVIDDGPTITHGGMSFGAGAIAARRAGAGLVDPRPYATGSIREAFETYLHIGDVLPALGYGEEQVKELEATIARTPCDAVVLGTPVDLRRLMRIDAPSFRVRYEYADLGEPRLRDVIGDFLRGLER